MQTDIDTDRFFRGRQGLVCSFYFASEAGEPLAVPSTDRAGLGRADQRAMDDDLYRADLGEIQHITSTITGEFEFAARGNLWKGDGVVDASPFESGISGFLAGFDPPKERLEGEIDTDGDVLEDLGVDAEEFGMRLFPPGQGCLLLSKGERLSVCFPEGGAL